MPLPPALVARDIPQALRLPAPLECRQYLLEGSLRTWTGPMQEVRSPIFVESTAGTERALLGFCPAHDAQAGEAALEAACSAWDEGLGPWPNLPFASRMACVEDFRRLMVARRAEIVRLMVWEIAKPLAQSEHEFDRTIIYIDETLDALKKLLREAQTPKVASAISARVLPAPLGVVLCMGPFNFPLNETLATLIPALLMGNTALVKLPRIGRLLFQPLMECFRRAFPPGVVNILSGGIETVTPALTSGKVDVLAFIGTSRAAEALRALHPRPNRLRCVLGLEAKNAAIVLPNADLDQALPELLRGAYGFAGQRCTALKLIFAHASLAAELTERLATAVAGLKVGLPWEHGVDIPPLPEPGKPEFLNALLKDALAKGAQVALGRSGQQTGALDETLFAPTLVRGVTPDMRLFHEEQFGPLCPIAEYEALDDKARGPLRAIARSAYGQQASIFGRDEAELARLADRLRNLVSRVNINCKCQRGPDALPFTARRDSAVGTLSVRDGLLAFSIPSLSVSRV